MTEPVIDLPTFNSLKEIGDSDSINVLIDAVGDKLLGVYAEYLKVESTLKGMRHA